MYNVAQSITEPYLRKRSGSLQGLIQINEEGDQLLKLGLRTTSLEKEIERLELPKEKEDLFKHLVHLREVSLAYRYDMVLVFKKLGMFGSYWEDFNYESLPEMLLAFDLPLGQTIGMWGAMVELFSRETFITIGDETISTMILEVSKHQSSTDKRKEDYKNIFLSYTKQYKVYNKQAFKVVINHYIHKTYVMRIVNEAAANNPEDKSLKYIARDIERHPDRKPPKTTPRGTTSVRVLRPADANQKVYPVITTDYAVVEKVCGGCRDKTILLQQAEHYILLLEETIKKKLGREGTEILAKLKRPTFLE